MAQVGGKAGRTSGHVEADKLLKTWSGSTWLLPVVGIATGGLIWSTNVARYPASAIVAFAIAFVGVLWTMIGGTPLGRWLMRISGRRMDIVAAAADLSVAIGFGAVAGLLLTQTPDTTIRIEVFAAALIVTVGAGWWRIRSALGQAARLQAGIAAEEEVARELAGLSSDYVVLNDVMLRSGSGACEADHVVLGPTGVFVIETKRWGGILTPGPTTWTQSGRRGTRTHPSPVVQLQRVQRAVASKLGIAVDRIMPILVLAGGRPDGDVGVQIVRPRALRSVILQSQLGWPLTARPDEVVRLLG